MGAFPGDSFRTITSEREYQIVSFGMAGDCGQLTRDRDTGTYCPLNLAKNSLLQPVVVQRKIVA